MNAPVKPLDFTNVKREPLSQSVIDEHRIGMRLPNMLAMHRREELELLEKLRAEAAMPERYPHQ